MRLIHRLIPRLHNILGLVVGGQVLLWILSGLFFTVFPIEHIRGEHLRAEVPASISLPEDGLAPLEGLIGADVATVRLKPFLGGAVYETETATGKAPCSTPRRAPPSRRSAKASPGRLPKRAGRAMAR